MKLKRQADTVRLPDVVEEGLVFCWCATATGPQSPRPRSGLPSEVHVGYIRGWNLTKNWLRYFAHSSPEFYRDDKVRNLASIFDLSCLRVAVISKWKLKHACSAYVLAHTCNSSVHSTLRKSMPYFCATYLFTTSAPITTVGAANPGGYTE